MRSATRTRPVLGVMLVPFAFWVMLDPVVGDLLPFMGPIVTVLGANCILVAGLMWGVCRGLATRRLGGMILSLGIALPAVWVIVTGRTP